MRIAKLLMVIVASLALYACGNDNIATPVASLTSTAAMNGGSAFSNISSQGGAGGTLAVFGANDVKINRSGTVDASFSIATPAYSFGSNPVTVNSNTTVAFRTYTSHLALPADGTLFVTDQYQPELHLVKSGGDTIVTGLKVNAGTTLKFPDNFSWGANGTYVVLSDAVVIDGTVTTTAEGLPLDLESRSYLKISATGKVTTAATNAGADGADLYLYSGGIAVNEGTLVSDGAAGGGSAGYAELDSEAGTYNTGLVSAKGGDNAAGSGGNGGWIGLYAYNFQSTLHGSVYNSGTLVNSGGNGTAGVGGDGGSIDIYSGDGWSGNTQGSLVIGGTLISNGGTGGKGNGGTAGYIYMEANQFGSAVVNAIFSSVGGSANGARFVGGNGNSVDIEVGDGGTIKLAGQFNTSGGSGDKAGGDAGDIVVIYQGNENYSVRPPAGLVELYGFSAVAANGGNGANGGAGGGLVAATYTLYDYDYDMYFPAGGITNEAAVIARGGAGVARAGYAGGSGGGVFVITDIDDFYSDVFTTVANSGSFDLIGGTGYTGGDGGSAWLGAKSNFINTGAIAVSGGAGAVFGGDAGEVLAIGNYDGYAGAKLNNSASITANGGSGGISGGDGGFVNLESNNSIAATTANTGTLSVVKGSGGATAVNGAIIIDGVDITPASGII